MKKLVLLLMLFGAVRSFGAVATNVQNLSQFGTTNKVVPGDGIGLSTRYGTASERLYGLRVSNLVSALNTFGAGTNTVFVSAGTNIIVVTNRTSSNVTYTISISSNLVADGVWTNDSGLIYPRVSNGQQTNSIQIYTNGGLSIGTSTRAYWGIQPGAGGETMISARNTSNGELDWNEWSIISTDGTNAVYQDYFLQASLNRRWLTMNSATTGKTEIDEFVDDDGDVMYRAWDGTNGGYRWRFQPGIALTGESSYLFNSYDIISSNSQIVVFQNAATNKVVINGLGYVGINTNAPSYPLHIFGNDIARTALEISYASGAGNTVAMQVRNGTGATNWDVSVGGLMRSVTINNSGTTTSDVATVTSLNVLGGTLGAGKVLTDVSGTGAATWQTGATLSGVTNIVTNYVNSVIGNYMSLSVQAAKLPTTNYPVIDAGWQNWELVFYPTNSDGFTNPLVATWQFIVPTNYFTNNMKVYGQSIILSTNGPTSTNTVWRASFLKATPGGSTDVHVGSFGSSVSVTQTWAASDTGTNKVQDFLIDMTTNSLLQANDFSILKLERVNDVSNQNEFKGGVSLIGLQLRY